MKPSLDFLTDRHQRAALRVLTRNCWPARLGCVIGRWLTWACLASLRLCCICGRFRWSKGKLCYPWHRQTSLADEYLTREQLRDAAPGRPSLRTLARWHTQRIGPPRVTIGRTILYPQEGLRRWLESLTQEPLR